MEGPIISWLPWVQSLQRIGQDKTRKASCHTASSNKGGGAIPLEADEVQAQRPCLLPLDKEGCIKQHAAHDHHHQLQLHLRARRRRQGVRREAGLLWAERKCMQDGARTKLGRTRFKVGCRCTGNTAEAGRLPQPAPAKLCHPSCLHLRGIHRPITLLTSSPSGSASL